MNYEALGRYTEARRKVLEFENEIKDQIKKINQCCNDLSHQITTIGSHIHSNHSAKQDAATLVAMQRAQEKLTEFHQSLCHYVQIANQNADLCGEPKLNYPVD